MNKIIYLLVLFCLLTGGCRPAAPVAPTTQVIPSETPKPTVAPLTLQSCTINGIKAECGTLHVIEDRANPNGRILDLAVVVLPALEPNHEPDPLFYLAGGPGDAATSTGHIVTENSLFHDVRSKRDIVFLDQRGTNGKHRLSCEIPFSIDTAPQQQLDDTMKECLAGLDGDPRFYTTAEAMRDLNEARAALGYDKINLYSISYGTTAAQVYMRLFPEHVRTAVLDHGTSLDLPFNYVLPRASQFVLDQVLTLCEQNQDCHTAYPDIRNDWQAILDRLAKGPVMTTYTPPGADSPTQVSMDDFANSMHQLLKAGSSALIPNLIHTLAKNEDWTQIVKSISERYGGGSGVAVDNRFQLMPNVINCFEPSWGYDLDEVSRLNPDSYYRELQVEWAKTQEKICAALPEPNPSLIYGPGQSAPISVLIFNSLLDPQNPPANMEPALKEFTRSRMVVEQTGGHEPVLAGCRWQLIAQYIQQGSADGLDTSCAEKTEQFFQTGTN